MRLCEAYQTLRAPQTSGVTVARTYNQPMDNPLERARETQRTNLRLLGYLAGGRDCASARYVCYRRSNDEPQWIDQWYLSTQIGADSALLAADAGFDRHSIDAAAVYLDLFRDPADGGYLARGSPDARHFVPGDKYCDDHGHLGLMMLDAWQATGDPRYLERARAAAEFLISGGVWDDVFGGGFWWNNRLGDSPEGKPAQANGLAAALFLKLHRLTGDSRYRTWSEQTLAWLNETLWEESVGLYRWSVAFADMPGRRGRFVAHRYFNYDQGIIIEALLERFLHGGGDPRDLQRAQTIAGKLESAFWQLPHGGFQLEAGQDYVMAIYSAWLTPSLLALYRVDPDPAWLALARRNVEALDRYLRSPEGDYYRGARQLGAAWTVEKTRDGVANAGMQRALARLAATENELAAQRT
jgi:uncharacterized protein YyaL (SSP411 family)